MNWLQLSAATRAAEKLLHHLILSDLPVQDPRTPAALLSTTTRVLKHASKPEQPGRHLDYRLYPFPSTTRCSCQTTASLRSLLPYLRTRYPANTNTNRTSATTISSSQHFSPSCLNQKPHRPSLNRSLSPRHRQARIHPRSTSLP